MTPMGNRDWIEEESRTGSQEVCMCACTAQFVLPDPYYEPLFVVHNKSSQTLACTGALSLIRDYTLPAGAYNQSPSG